MAKNYKYENAKNQARYAYIPPAAPPTLDITINQNSAPSPVYAPGGYARRSPSAPPPPPPISEYAQPAYNPMWFDRFPRRENRGMFRLCLVEFLLGVVIFGGGIWCLRTSPAYCPYFSAVWTSSIYLINAIVGTIAAKNGHPNMYIAHLVLSLIAVMMCIVSGIISSSECGELEIANDCRNWLLVGTYQHPRIDRNDAFCLLGQHDATRLSYIFSHLDRYNFAQCLWELKVGVAVTSVQFVVAVIEGLLNLLSSILCLKRVCDAYTM